MTLVTSEGSVSPMVLMMRSVGFWMLKNAGDEAGERRQEYDEREQGEKEAISQRRRQVAEVVFADFPGELALPTPTGPSSGANRDVRGSLSSSHRLGHLRLRASAPPLRIYETMSFRWNHHQAKTRKTSA